ncbi:DUF4232 domain-containing protein [Pseudosporangium ferrugineum]|uniref:Uncharacterized protein DUF4232 n=1 Tax=Pseudosporangium ferrugineum TaxID=439699 RepID=A0A2T0R987_9ACTN|nr:DUF4232 domain-containing protein [Pseudosporangium ferrugineum]PRY17715.1 uncharacterized protein DUF4232 [Pseudosporangium ferrugineum]
MKKIGLAGTFAVAAALTMTGCATPAASTGSASTGSNQAPSNPKASAPELPAPVSSDSGPANPGDPCTGLDVAIKLGPAAGQRHATLVFTNTGDVDCSISGYSAVTLVGPDVNPYGPRYELPRQKGQTVKIMMKAGDTVTAKLTFLTVSGSDGWTPKMVEVTAPGAAKPTSVAWPDDSVSVLRQDAATHPGTYIGPISPVV